MARKTLLLSVMVVASFVLAQARPAVSPSRADAGVAVARPAASDAGTPVANAQGGGSSEVDKLRKEVAELRQRTAELERQNQTKSDALTAQFEKFGKQLEDMKGQLTKLNETEERRSDAEEAAQSHRSAKAAASTSLNGVLGGLALGTTAGVDSALQYAESVFTGNAQHDVQLARAALSQNDLNATRSYLLLALMEAEAQNK